MPYASVADLKAVIPSRDLQLLAAFDGPALLRPIRGSNRP